jgi:uncharacterized protein YcfJ
MLTLLFIACAQGPEYERGYNDGCDMAILDAESCLDADIPVAEDEYGNGVLAAQGAVAGGLTGAQVGAATGTPYGIAIGAVIGALGGGVVGGVRANKQYDEAAEAKAAEAKAKQDAEELAARRSRTRMSDDEMAFASQDSGTAYDAWSRGRY